MIVPDVNLLVYAYSEPAPQYPSARRWREDLVSGSESVGIPWIVSVGFIRQMANPLIHNVSMPLATGAAIVDAWFEHDHIFPLNPGDYHMRHMRDALAEFGASASVRAANRATDVHIAALALEYGAEVHTNDTDFNRIPGLHWRNPL